MSDIFVDYSVSLRLGIAYTQTENKVHNLQQKYVCHFQLLYYKSVRKIEIKDKVSKVR